MDAKGQWHWFYDRSINRRVHDHDIEIEGLAMDISDLRRTEERFATFFSLSTDFFCIASLEGYFLLINPAGQKMLGYPMETLLENPLFEFVHPEDRDKTLRIIEEKLKQGEKVINFTNRYLCKDGSVKWLEWASHPKPDQQITFAVARDCTERLKMESDLKNAITELERSNEELNQFASIASHDLQEPLRAVVGFLQLLQDRYKEQLDEKGLRYIDRSVRAGHRMQNLINDLLKLSRLRTGAQNAKPVDLNEILHQVKENLHTIIQENHVVIHQSTLPTIVADEHQMISLFQNLIANAIKYNTSSPPVIHIGFQNQGDQYRFFVKDNGIGISPKYHDKIFQTFQRLHTHKDHSGTGIGLALCKSIVEKHGGVIQVESEPEKGARFQFTLPKLNGFKMAKTGE